VGLLQLDNLVRARQLKTEAGSQIEIDGLLRSGHARLKDAQLTRLSLDSRFDLAYNAAHAFSLAALRWHGYRSENRYLVFQCLEHTVKIPAEQWRVLDQAHRKRNIAEYEGHLDFDRSLVEALLRVATEVASRVAALGPVTPGGQAPLTTNPSVAQRD
jgi:hypothetical protein